ncbi:hypothetical protein UlMin_045857 [Ulmus minor]
MEVKTSQSVIYWMLPMKLLEKSNNGTLYKAFLQQSNSMRLLRPVFTLRVEYFDDLIYKRFGSSPLNPISHGNLKSKNILLDHHFQPYVSDSGLHLLLNPTAGQEMLESLASQGYKAPEPIKMKEASERTDVYSFGVILLELLIGKEPINENPTAPEEDFYLPNFLRNAVLGQRVQDFEEQVFKFIQLAMACCSPSPFLRPTMK